MKCRAASQTMGLPRDGAVFEEKEKAMADTEQSIPRSAASITALVLGIIALVMSWMPIINNFAFIFGALGLIFGIVGLIGVMRGKKAGKGIAIAALIVSVLSLAIVLGTQSMYSAAIDDAVNGPAATSAAPSDQDNGADEPSGEEPQDEARYTDLAAGTSVELENGLTVTVDSVETGLANYDGSVVVGVHVTYTNNGDDTANYNPYDWKGEDAQGAQEYTTFYSEGADELSSGTLAAGGSVSGNVYFEDGTVKALYFASMVADEPTASWTLS